MVIIRVNRFVMGAPVGTVLDLAKGLVHVENQSFLCHVQKMCLLAGTVVTKLLNVECIDVHSAATGVPVKPVDRKLKSSAAAENT